MDIVQSIIVSFDYVMHNTLRFAGCLIPTMSAVVNYKRAIELEPNLATNREYLEKAQAKVRAGLGNRSGAGLSGGAGGDEVCM